MDQFAIAVLSGIASGAVYGLVGLGLVVIFRSTHVVNFATTSMVLFCSYIALGIGVPPIFAFLLGMIFAALFGLLVNESVIRPLAGSGIFAAVVATLGLSMIIDHLTADIWGTRSKAFPALIDGSLSISYYSLPLQDVLTIIAAAAAVALVAFIFHKTSFGIAMRASAEDAEAAELIGLSPVKIARLAWMLGTVLALIGGFLYLPASGIAPGVLSALLFRAFAGVLLGGINSMVGAVIGGLAIGVLDNLAALYVGSGFRDSVVFSVAVAVLLIRPQGLFGRIEVSRV